MPLSLVHTSSFTSPFESKNYTSNLNPTTLLLPNSFFPDFQTQVPTNVFKSLLCLSSKRRSHSKRAFTTTTTHASLLEAPVLWAGRLCIFYALLKAGLAGSQSNPLVSGLHLFKYTLLLDNGVHLFASFSGFVKLFNLFYFIVLSFSFRIGKWWWWSWWIWWFGVLSVVGEHTRETRFVSLTILAFLW